MRNNTFPKKTLFSRHAGFLICLVLSLTTFATYYQVTDHDFINYDDNAYVTDNRHVQSGLTWKSITWAFTDVDEGNWHPLTWLSHMLDIQLYGLNPGQHHLTNLLFHIASTLLLFLALRRMTDALWQSAFVAALFALHPLHIESIAWIAERKDVLSTFFWMLTLWSYARYAEQPGVKTYLPVLFIFMLGLMSKAMLVTLPFVLLLLDYWPLKRLQTRLSGHKVVFLEKVPFFVLSATICIVTYIAQQRGGAVVPLALDPLDLRIANALVSYIAYIGKMIWPYHLAVLYPHPGVLLQTWQIVGSCLLLLTFSLLAILTVKRQPYFAVGWLWYMGTLVPVIGLVQVGVHAFADRYTYVTLIGLFIAIAWGIPETLAKWRHRRSALIAAASVFLSILIVTSLLQIRYWKNDIVLFSHAVQTTSNNYVMHTSLGLALAESGMTDKAIGHYKKALQIHPGFSRAHCNLGIALDSKNRLMEAGTHFSEALKIKPGYAEAHNGLGLILGKQGMLDDAIRHFSIALQEDPLFAEAHSNLGVALMRNGKVKEAVIHFQEALRIKPGLSGVNLNLKTALRLLEK